MATSSPSMCSMSSTRSSSSIELNLGLLPAVAAGPFFGFATPFLTATVFVAPFLRTPFLTVPLDLAAFGFLALRFWTRAPAN